MKNCNIPNTVTFIRLCIGLCSVYTLVQGYTLLTLIFFLIFIVSDKLDGFLARKLKQETTFGANFDVISDFVFIVSILITFYYLGYINTTPFVLVIITGAIMNLANLLLFHRHKEFQSTIYDKISGLVYYIWFLIFLFPTLFMLGSYAVIISNCVFMLYKFRKLLIYL